MKEEDPYDTKVFKANSTEINYSKSHEEIILLLFKLIALSAIGWRNNAASSNYLFKNIHHKKNNLMEE